jgi:hypothetical protein
MRSISIRALGALVAVLALSALASTAAQAEAFPRFSVYGGVKITGSIPAVRFEDNAYAWDYGQGEISGEISGANAITNVTIALKEGNEYGCDTTGYPKYELKWTGLRAHLGFINKEKSEVGLLFEGPTSLPKGEIGQCNAETSFIFGNGSHQYAGHLIARIRPGRTEKEFELPFAGDRGKQEIAAFEGEKAFPFEIGYTWECRKEEFNKKVTEECGFSQKKWPLSVESDVTLKTSSNTKIET